MTLLRFAHIDEVMQDDEMRIRKTGDAKASLVFLLYNIAEKKRANVERVGGRRAFFHLSVIADEKKIGQTSDVSEKASKRFKALKYSTRRLVYQ